MRVFSKASCKKRNSFLYLGMVKEPLLLAISPNLVKVFKCFAMLDRSLGSSPISGTLNFCVDRRGSGAKSRLVGGHKLI